MTRHQVSAPALHLRPMGGHGDFVTIISCSFRYLHRTQYETQSQSLTLAAVPHSGAFEIGV